MPNRDRESIPQPPDRGREDPERQERDKSTPYDINRRYDDVYLRNRKNWDNPNSGTSMNSPVWNDEADWESPEVERVARDATRPDAAVQAEIVNQLALNDRLGPRPIDVQVQDHVATLSGTMESEDEKQQAEQIARDVAGVDQVINKLKVGR